VLAAYVCTDIAGGGGVATCSGTEESGTHLDTASPGAKTFTVTANDTSGNVNTRRVAFTVVAPVSESDPLPSGGTVTTDPGGGPTAVQPVYTTVTSPNPGTVSINQAAVTVAAPQGFRLLGLQIDISAPPASAASPLTLQFDVDAALLPLGQTKDTVALLKDGALVLNCLGASTLPPGVNSCITARDDAPSGGGDGRLVVISTSASDWNLAAGAPLPPTMSSGPASVVEGNSGTRVVNVPVTLSAPSALPVSANWNTANVSATAPGDYTSASGSVTFPPGQTQVTVPITVKGDTTVEPSETVRVELSSPVNATVGASGLATITNDDTAPAGFRVVTASLPSARLNVAYFTRLTAAAGTAPYKWKKIGALPKGLKLGAKTGVISGVPKKAAGTFTFKVRVTDAKKPKPARVAEKTFTIRVT
jgi:hypothetical protein